MFNQELRAQQSSITTLDRTQLPGAFVDSARLQDYALHQVWFDEQVGATGEQTNEVDTLVPDAAWESSTIQTSHGGWRTLTETTLTGFKGGSLFVEWSANVYLNNIFSYGINDGRPGTPNYMGMRILANGVSIAERRGGGYHQQCRIFGSQLMPPGDLTLTLQWRSTDQSQDAAATTASGARMPYAHLWNNRWIAIARYR
jgi:hypothetical protein